MDEDYLRGILPMYVVMAVIFWLITGASFCLVSAIPSLSVPARYVMAVIIGVPAGTIAARLVVNLSGLPVKIFRRQRIPDLWWDSGFPALWGVLVILPPLLMFGLDWLPVLLLASLPWLIVALIFRGIGFIYSNLPD